MARHGGQLHLLAETFGIPLSKLLDFSANINPDGPPESVLNALHGCFRRTETLTQYPDLEERELKTAFALYAGCSIDNVLAGNGFVPLLEATVRALGVRTCLVPMPAFNEYRRVLEQNGVRVKTAALDPELDFIYDIPALLADDHDAILIANPQNPSGLFTERAALIDLVTQAASRGILVLLDEAFIDYMQAGSLTAATSTFRNLVVFRSVTKCFGIPGLRVAFAASQPELRQRIEQYLPPWAISTLASTGVIAALLDEAFAGSVSLRNLTRRRDLEFGLRRLGLKVYPSSANFLLFRLPESVDAHQLWLRLVGNHGIVLRSCENFESLPYGHLRTAVRLEDENQALLKALTGELFTKGYNPTRHAMR